jgi:HD-like signal output (HDOD) protein
MEKRHAVIRYFELLGVAYSISGSPPDDAGATVPVRAELMISGGERTLAILPARSLLDVTLLEQALGQPVSPAAASTAQCHDSGDFVPLPRAYEFRAAVDASVYGYTGICFRVEEDCWLRVPIEDAHRLWRAAPGLDFARTPVSFVRPEFEELAGGGSGTGKNTADPLTSLRQRVAALAELPPLPEIAFRILQLRADPYADAADLAAIIELDPPLAARVIRYASSPFYGYQGRIDSLRDAVTRVLGFDMVMNLAIGMQIGKALRIQRDGPLGLDAFWAHAVRSAVMCEALARLAPKATAIRPGMAYLAGLLHDIGYLVLGHVFRPGFELLNRSVALNVALPVLMVESHVLGVRHDQIGAWLMRSWKMPAELTVATRRHHDTACQGEFCAYAGLVQIADRVLRRYGSGDADAAGLPEAQLDMLGMHAEQVLVCAGAVMARDQGLDELAMQFAA